MLRLFQLKAWLLDDSPDYEALVNARKLFASMSLDKQILAAMKESDDPRPSKALKIARRRPQFAQMFDWCFDDPNGLSSLCSLGCHSRYQEISERDEKKLCSIDQFTLYCLRAQLATSPKSIKDTANKLYRFAARHGDLSKEIAQVRTERRARGSFLFVMRTKTRVLLSIPDRKAALWSLLATQSAKTTAFQLYFARCAYVQKVMAHGSDISADDIENWADREAEKPYAIDPITKDEIEAAEAYDLAQLG